MTSADQHLKAATARAKPKDIVDIIVSTPITIRVTGTYHEFGNFVSTVASLPRIVTQHDVNISPVVKGGKATGGDDKLLMNMVAKTYRYLEEEEIEAARAAKEKNKKGKNRKKKKKRK